MLPATAPPAVSDSRTATDGHRELRFREEIQQQLSPPISGPFLLLLIPGKAFRRRWQYIL